MSTRPVNVEDYLGQHLSAYAMVDGSRSRRNAMRAVTAEHSLPQSRTRRLQETLRAAGPSLLFGLRLWASVSLALYVAFWLELDHPYWAGASAAIVCQPQLGASLRKGWFRIIGTVIGAAVSVVLVACFPQDRVLFLGGLAVWASISFTRVTRWL